MNEVIKKINLVLLFLYIFEGFLTGNELISVTEPIGTHFRRVDGMINLADIRRGGGVAGGMVETVSVQGYQRLMSVISQNSIYLLYSKVNT